MKVHFEHIGSAILYHADCREVLKSFGPTDITIVSDPPYGIKFVKGKTGGAGLFRSGDHKNARSDHKIIGDQTPFDPSHLLAYDNVLLWGANHYCHRLPEGRGRWLAWNKLEMKESFDSFSDVEFAWHSVGKVSRMFNYLWKGIVRRHDDADGKKRAHPMMKPAALMKWCVEQTNSTGIVLDPYMGSGSTGVACARLGRPFVGIEIERKWFDVACERITREAKR